MGRSVQVCGGVVALGTDGVGAGQCKGRVKDLGKVGGRGVREEPGVLGGKSENAAHDDTAEKLYQDNRQEAERGLQDSQVCSTGGRVYRGFVGLND